MIITQLRTLRTLLETALTGTALTDALKQIDEMIASAERAQAGAKTKAEQSFNEVFTIAGQATKALREENKLLSDSLGNLVEDYERLKKAGSGATAEEIEHARISAINKKAELDANKARQKVLKDTQKTLKKTMGLGYELGDSFLGSALLAGGGFAEMGQAIADVMNPAKLLGSGLMQIEKATMKLFTSFDSTQAQLAKTTGTTGEYNDMLYKVQEQNRSYNVDVEAAGAAIGDLHKELSIFNQMSTEQQTMLTETTARMKALGVSTQAGAQQFDNMIQGMGMTANMANDASLEMVALGDSIGVAADQLSEGFNAAASELAKYGPDAIDVFKGMAAAAKSTGIEMSSLMSITKQFDTFEGAAQSAGKLNAILGGGVVNSMDLLNATEEERVRLLIQSMSLSGKNFESLNRFEKQAIASAAGISDMTEANKLFSMSLSAYDDMQSKANGAEAAQAKLQERAQAATELADKLKQIGQGFAVAFMPILDFFHGFANIVLELNDMTGGIFLPTMVALVGVVYLLMNVQTLYNAAMSTARGLNITLNLLRGQQITTTQMLTLTQQVQALQSRIAAMETRFLTAAITQLLIAVAPLLPAITAIAFAIGALAIAMAAPFVLVAVMIYSFTELVKAMLAAPEAIAAAVAGVLSFAVAGGIALIIMAKAMAYAVTILTPFALQMMVVAPALMYFGAAMAVAAGAFYLLAVGLERMAGAMKAWKGVKFKHLQTAALALGMFTLLMIPLAVPMATIGLLVGLPLILFGIGLQKFAEGLIAFNKVGVVAMITAAAALLGFTLLMIALVVPLTVIGLLVGLPLMLLGMGLQQFAKGLKLFNKIGAQEIITAMASLWYLTIALTSISLLIPIIGLLVAIPLILLGFSLQKFAEGLRTFNKIGAHEIIAAVLSLTYLTVVLTALAVPLAIIGLLVAIPLILLGHGLMSFAKGLRKFNAIGAEAILAAVASLTWLAVTLFFLGPFLAYGALLVAIPLMLLGKGLVEAAAGIMAFNDVGPKMLDTMVAALSALAFALIFSGIPIATFGTLVAIPLALVSISLGIFAKALQAFNEIDIIKSLAGIALLFVFAHTVKQTGIYLGLYAPMFAQGLIVASAGLAVFAKALHQFTGLGLGTIFIAIAALLSFALAMAFLIQTGLMAYMIVGFYAMAMPMAMFGASLLTIGAGLLLVAAGIPALMALSDALSIIAQIGFFGASAMAMLSASIFGIALALMFIPESKTIAFGFAMQGYSSAMAAVSALTPESVEAAEKVVASAAEYAEIQATMRMPDEDSFIQAMKNVFGVGEGKDKKQGQDIVLKLNGRELGRAVNAAIDKRHNLAID